MTVLRCTAKLLKHLKQPAKPAEPALEANPLGEWYADIDFWHRHAFVVMLNAATGAVLVLDGKADSLRRLHERALLQFAALCEHYGLSGPGVDAELRGFAAGLTCGPTRDRSLLASLNQRKGAAWLSIEQGAASLFERAAREWDGLFQHPALGRDARFNSEYHVPLQLLRQRLAAVGTFTSFSHNLH